MWFGNSLHPRITTNKFYYNKFGIIQIGVEALSQTQIPNTPKIALSYKYKPKNQIQIQEPKVHKYQIRIPNTNYALTKERATKQIQNLQCTKREQITKLQNQNQAVTNLSHYSKLQPTNIKEPNEEKAFFSHTLIFHSFSNFP